MCAVVWSHKSCKTVYLIQKRISHKSRKYIEHVKKSHKSRKIQKGTTNSLVQIQKTKLMVNLAVIMRSKKFQISIRHHHCFINLFALKRAPR